MMLFKKVLTCLGLGATLFFSPAASAQQLEKLSIVIFGWPSLGALLPPIIKAQKLDAKQGMDIEFAERTPDAYTAQFNSGEFKVGGSAALLTVGLADLRGVKVAYLFNIFDFYGTIVTSEPQVKALKDLEGKTLAAARGTTNFVMASWFATQQGVDMKKVSVVNTATTGLVGYALANRAEGIQVWEPALTTIRAKNPVIRDLDLHIAQQWTKFAGSANVPYLGLAAHIDWIGKNPGTVGKLWQMHKEAADWMQANPEAAARVITPKGDAESLAGLVALIKANDRLGLNMKWAGDIGKEIEQVYKAGRSIDFLPGDPASSTIYSGK